ncbi:hypothetical protein GS444_17970 [Rhodococcus hoagii]|nr:hypothetical protein [Prescottella equi]
MTQEVVVDTVRELVVPPRDGRLESIGGHAHRGGEFGESVRSEGAPGLGLVENPLGSPISIARRKIQSAFRRRRPGPALLCVEIPVETAYDAS